MSKKNNLWKIWFFFQTLQIFERTFTVLGENFSGRDIKIENCTLCLQSITLKIKNFFESSAFFSNYFFSTFENSVFFSNSSDFWTNIHRAWRKFFGREYQNWKLYSMSSEYHFEDKTFFESSAFFSNYFFSTFENSVFFQILQIFERTSTVLGKNFLGGNIKIENYTLCLQSIILKIKKFFSKFLFFFSNYSAFWTNIYCACRESFRQGYQNWKKEFSSHKINQKIKLLKVLFIYQILQIFDRTFTLLGEKSSGRNIKIENCTLCLQSIILKIKNFFWKFCKFSFISDLEHKIFGFVATEFSPGLSKRLSSCVYEFSSRCW